MAPKLYPLLMSELEQELIFLTNLYRKYRNIVLQLREMYQDAKPDVSEIKPNISQSKVSNHGMEVECSVLKGKKGASSMTTVQNKERARQRSTGKKKPYKRETL